MTFKAWMAAIDAEVAAIAGVSVYDLADYPFRDNYDPDATEEDIQEIAREILEEEGFPFED